VKNEIRHLHGPPPKLRNVKMEKRETMVAANEDDLKHVLPSILPLLFTKMPLKAVKLQNCHFGK